MERQIIYDSIDTKHFKRYKIQLVCLSLVAVIMYNIEAIIHSHILLALQSLTTITNN